MTVRQLTPTEEAGTIRVPIQKNEADHLTRQYRLLVSVQDDLTTILYAVCRFANIDPADVVGYDDEHGELLVKP